MEDHDVPPPTLSAEINIATRSLHTTLNRLITSRLPLALPPHTADPTLYTTGLLHFAHIFLTFESLWTDLLSSSSSSLSASTSIKPSASPTTPPTSPPTSPLLSFLLVNPYDSPSLFSSPPSPRMLTFLSTLRPTGLARSPRLKEDLRHLTGLSETDLDVLLAHYPGEKVREYCEHIRREVGYKPHLLVAYAWCFYMAVFSGGRWIRGELREAGTDFWTAGTEAGTTPVTANGNDEKENGEEKKGEKGGSDEKLPAGDMGLSLWSFPGPLDGQDIKSSFKARLLLAETFFTPDERVDIIEEAKQIFILSAGLVEELDIKLGTDEQKLKHPTLLSRKEDKGEKRDGRQDESVGLIESKSPSSTAATFLRRPEVTGAAVALGCLACFVLLKVDGGSVWWW